MTITKKKKKKIGQSHPLSEKQFLLLSTSLMMTQISHFFLKDENSIARAPF